MTERYNPLFTPANVDSARDDRGAALRRLPFGVVVVDRHAKVVDYNEHDEQLAAPRKDVLGKNFFEQVAPWAAGSDFKGRWDDFIASRENMVLPFDFTLPGPRGPIDLTIMFVRVAFDADHATICIAQKAKVPTA